ncbi:carbohydrate kinase [Hydrogenovibrio sp. SC-1]|uniref:carbohydrate kinase family protein n=1 Tax=Hydrogenovibrio sp. SC-1 TaxID=2065820 RepID=UPI000C7AC6DE|nr:carbohydrate kinase [Hydrogenovibrio sp. SC-1]PLA73433.1 carbohydrate kinase [Hydrogenovibrio sp. SC-1]
MTPSSNPLIFGEALFDCFDSGEQVLGGAPFNIAWHLEALGDAPYFISKVGQDALGERILNQASQWGMATETLQTDSQHPTGQVAISIIDGEPHYDIRQNCAYDFIDLKSAANLPKTGLLYHGSLALRHPHSRKTFETLVNKGDYQRFLDVNLREPWWQKQTILDWIAQASWVKLNHHELHQLEFTDPLIQNAMLDFQQHFPNAQLIVTRGEVGTIVLTQDGHFFEHTPPKVNHIIDTVGAGDAFTAVYIHGLISKWPIQKTLEVAQAFASQIIGNRGATSADPQFYKSFQSLYI